MNFETDKKNEEGITSFQKQSILKIIHEKVWIANFKCAFSRWDWESHIEQYLYQQITYNPITTADLQNIKGLTYEKRTYQWNQ
jgi:hypothetical protein